MKKTIWILLVLAMTCITAAALATADGSSEHMNWTIDSEGTLTISGNGTMDMTFPFEKDIKKVVINKGITDVAYNAFNGCRNLTSVTLPEGVTEIGDVAFYYCSSLKKINFPETLKTIGGSALAYTGLKEITVPDQVTSVGNGAFSGIEKIYAAVGSDGAKALGKAGLSFREPKGNCLLQYVYANNELKGLEIRGADSDVKTLTVPEGVTAIAPDCFSGNNTLTVLNLPKGLVSIGENAFRSCRELKNLVLPESVKNIDQKAFCYWNGTLVFLGNAPTIDSEAFAYASVIVIYPHAGERWSAVIKNTFGANWITWQADNQEAATDPNPKSATESLTQTQTDNENGHDYVWNWAGTVDSYLVPEDGGGFTRVEHVGDDVVIEQYSKETELVWKKTLTMDLPIWGGFFAGTDYNFFVFGQSNDEEDNNKEVVRIVRYSKKWNRIDSASAYGQNTTLPFRAGTVDMDQGGDYLYVHTCHQMYTHTDGKRHQANMTFKLYIPTMSISIDASSSPGYTSHSFNQVIYVDEGNLIMVDHGDAYPRAVTIGRAKNDTDAPGVDNFQRVTLLEIGGETGDNYTGATVGGSKASDTHYIVTGKSIDQEHYDTSKRDNVYVVTASKSDFSDASVSFRWQTKYPEGSTVVLANPYLISISGTRLLLIWAEKLNSSDMNVLLHYVFLNEDGAAVSDVYTNPGKLSDVEPVVNGDYLNWYVTTGNDVIFYSLNLNNPAEITTVSNLVWLGKQGWVQDGAGHWLYGNEQGYAVIGLQQIDGKMYFFNKNGIMATGWVSDNGTWYCAKNNGELYNRGWELMAGQWYYFRNNGVMETGWLSDGKKYYYLGADGAMKTGWIQDNGFWYFLKASGEMETGWVRDGGRWYYLNAKGQMQTGWIADGEKWYYLASGGAMQTGWIQYRGEWYYLAPDGAMKTGWILDGLWYYLGPDGAMKTGWVLDGGKWYYLASGGSMQTGWVLYSGNWYYMKADGAMATGWFEDTTGGQRNRWYWFDDGGRMATGWKEIHGRWELFDENGLWQYTWNGAN